MFVNIGNQNVAADAITSTSVDRIVLYDEQGDVTTWEVTVHLTDGRTLVVSSHSSEPAATTAIARLNRDISDARGR